MRLIDYIKDKVAIIFMYFAMMILVTFFLSMFIVPYPLTISIVTIMIMFLIIFIIYDYNRKSSFYNKLIGNLQGLDKKYLVTELVERPNFIEGKIFYDSLYEIDKSMYEEIETYKDSINDFKEYIEMWIHEVKLPIASTTLILHNNKADANKKIKYQINRVENYVEQVLYFVRGENAQKDYIIKSCSLDEVVKNVIKKNKDSLLLKHISIEIINIDKNVLSDSKWIEFIINQIVSNSIKYSREENAKIRFNTKFNDDLIILEIEDNGMGISEKDINRVFDKSFTGKNGRKITNSTGMGLYLVKKLCNKLGHNISIESKLDEYTKVSIYFKDNKYYSVVR